MSWNTNARRWVESRRGEGNMTSHSLWSMEELLVVGGGIVERDERKMEVFVEPTPLLTDFIEISLLGVVFLIGTPLNLVVLFKLVAEYRKRTAGGMIQRDLGTSLTLMKAHLTVCNLLVLLLFCPFKIIWLATYQWMAGELMCRWAHSLWLFAFCASSNVVAVIAVDRMRLVYRFGRAQRGRVVVTSVARNCVRFAKIMLGTAWAMAAVCSIPQQFVWTTVSIQLPSNRTWSQCTTVWQKQSACAQFNCIDRKNNTIQTPSVSRLTYHMFHMVTVFWLPFALVLISYVYIVLELMRYVCCSYSALLRRPVSKYSDSSASDEFALATVRTHTSATDGSNSGERVSISRINHLPMAQLNIITKICPIERASGAETTLLSENGSVGKKKMQPLWRSQMRSRMFRTSASIVGCYVLCWLPYNILALGVEISREWEEHISEHAEWIKWFVLLNALLNPFLYGRRKDGCL